MPVNFTVGFRGPPGPPGSAAPHQHAIADVTGLRAELDSLAQGIAEVETVTVVEFTEEAAAEAAAAAAPPHQITVLK